MGFRGSEPLEKLKLRVDDDRCLLMKAWQISDAVRRSYGTTNVALMTRSLADSTMLTRA